MYTFHQHIGTHNHLFAKGIYNGTIIANAEQGASIAYFVVTGKVVYESKFSKRSYFCAFIVHRAKLIDFKFILCKAASSISIQFTTFIF
jgi:hypothetical protein